MSFFFFKSNITHRKVENDILCFDFYVLYDIEKIRLVQNVIHNFVHCACKCLLCASHVKEMQRCFLHCGRNFNFYRVLNDHGY